VGRALPPIFIMSRHFTAAVFLLLTTACAHVPDAAVIDDPLDPQAAAFFSVPDKPEDPDGAAVGLRGLGAPPGTDFMQYGREWADRRGSDPNALQVVWDPEKADCWLWIDDSSRSPEDHERCAAAESEIVEMLRDNALIMDRYRQVQRLRGSSLLATKGMPFITMSKLTDIDMTLDSRHGRHEQALRKWAVHHEFLQRMSAESGTWFDVAINQVNENLSLSTLESLLWRAPQITNRQAEELLAVLRPSTMARYDIAALMRWNYKAVQYFYETSPDRNFLAPNYIANHYYRYSQHVIESSERPRSVIDAFELGPSDPNFLPTQKFLATQFAYRNSQLISSMHRSNRLMRLLTMKVRVMKESVPDDRIGEYVAAHGDELRDPESGSPARWDSEKRVLYYEIAEPWEIVRL
jgi:hypothetical protein